MILITDAVGNTLKIVSNKYVKQKKILQSNGTTFLKIDVNEKNVSKTSKESLISKWYEFHLNDYLNSKLCSVYHV